VLLSTAGVAHAGDKPLYQPAPGWVIAAPAVDTAKLDDAAPVLQIFDQQQRLEDGQVSIYFESAIRIASPQMLTQSGTLPLQWDPAKGDLIIHKLQILRAGERVDLLAKGTRFTVLQREQKLEQFALDGMLTATVALEGLRVGDVIDIAFTTTRKDAVLGKDMMSIVPMVPAPAKLGFGRARLLWKDGVPLAWRDYSGGVVGSADLRRAEPKPIAGGYRELTLPLPTPKPAELPEDAPARYKPLPMLDVSTYADWAALSRAMAPYYRSEGAIAPGSPLAAEVERIAAASKDPRTRAAMALRLVQDQVRYLFRGMDNGNYRPQTPAQTWTLRYGDCKAKTLLLVSLLRALDIEAEPALVSSGMGDLVESRLPSPAAFDHVIVRAVVDGKTLWLDGTQGGSRAEDLDDVPLFRTALPIRVAGAGLEAMPMRPPARPAQQVAVTLDATAGIEFPQLYTIRIVYSGGMAEALRGARSQIDKDKLAEFIDPQISAVLGVHSTYDQKMEDDAAGGTVTLTAAGVAYQDWNYDRGRLRLTLDSTAEGLNFAPNRSRAAWKTIPAISGAPADVWVERRVQLPEGGKGFTLEGQQTLPATLAGMQLARKVALADGSLSLQDRTTTGLQEVPAAQIPAARAEVARVKANPLRLVAPADHPPRWAAIMAAKSNGRLKPILDAYAKAIAAKPDDADNYTNRAWFYETIYDRQAAITDLTKAVELAATADTLIRRASAYYALRQDDKALADVQAALELEPDSDGATGLLATFKRDRGQMDEARGLIDARIDQGGEKKLGWQMQLADLLAGGGQVTEAVAILDEAIAAAPGNASLLNSRCWIRATHNVAIDQALKDCTSGVELSRSSAAVLDSRAMVYFRMGRLDAAITDLDAALLASPEQAASLFMRGVIGKRMKSKDADAYLAAARMIEPRIDERFARFGIKA
jgi:tetratricopeptide (TPR) repeat protein/transglutaminase-like putative cysteine protease